MRRMEAAVARTDCPGGEPTSLKVRPKMKRKDLLRRFTPTPYSADLLIMAKTVRLESNSRAVVKSALEFFARHQGPPPGDPEFLWRIVAEEDSKIPYAGVALSAFSEGGLRFANLGPGGFLAVDLEAREGVGFVAERLVESEPTLHCRSVFDTLFCMSIGSLGLVPFSAACVGRGENGILIFGRPNSGKTTTSYFAAKLGLEFHADQAVFLEIEAGHLRVWGDLLPAIFRPFQALKAHSVGPVCCVFLERQAAATPTLSPIARFDFSRRLTECMLFKDYDCLAQQSAMTFDALEKLPAYLLAYGSDPATAAVLVRKLLA
jgi:hypothetical protein